MSQNMSSGSQTDAWRKLLKAAAKPFLFLLFLTMICAFLAHYLVGSETLEEYAQNDPEAAYGTAPDASDDSDTSGIPDTSDDSGAPNTTDSSSDPDTSDDSGAPGITDGSGTLDAPDAYNTTEDDQEAAEDMSDSTPASGSPDRITYQEGFYYEPLTDEVKERITGISYPETGCTVPYEDLAYVGLLYIDFNGDEQTGELICNKAIAQDMVEIFYELYRNEYRIERVRLVDEYGGDDTLSMLDDNTSCFNYRTIDGTDRLSKHALGCAIDINPFYNPYIVYNKNGSGETYISPKGSEIYADRSQDFPYKIDENDLCYKLFTQHGFTWGGNWNSTKDYQHFQIVLP